MNELKPIIRGTYDLQKLRIMMGNRIVGNFKAKLGQSAGLTEDELSDDAKLILNKLRASYKKITDGVANEIPKKKQFTGDEVISTYSELVLFHHYLQIEDREEQQFKTLEVVLRDFPLYTDYLKSVKGVGPAMSGVILSEIDISKAEYPSSLWKYAGLDVGPDGKGRSKKAEHLIDITYIDRDGNEKTKKSITFNPFLKTKLMGVLSKSFLRAGDNPYSKMYYDYKNRLENHLVYRGDEKGKKGHRHNMALRYMIKRFLVDLHIAWRTLEGLPVSEEYSVAKLKMKHKKEP